MSNFHCNDCGKDFHIPRFRISVGLDNQTKYQYPSGRNIACEYCDSSNISSIETGEICVNFGKFSSSDNEGKRKMLKKRAKDHHERKIKERQEYLRKNFRGKNKDLTGL